jgi:sulfonate transport system substrate-binding protein
LPPTAIAPVPSRGARRGFADGQAELLHAILEQIRLTDEWARGHRDEVARLLGPLLGIDSRTSQRSFARAAWGIRSITGETLGAQQRIADAFHELGLVLAPLDVRRALPKTPAL